MGAKKVEGKESIRWTYTATGSVTNLAARLVQAAQGGEVFMSEETALRVESRGDVVAAGKHQFKGFAREVNVYCLSRQPLANDNLRGLARSVGDQGLPTLVAGIIDKGDTHG